MLMTRPSPVLRSHRAVTPLRLMALLWVWLTVAVSTAQAQVELPTLQVPVEDRTATLSAAQIKDLGDKLRALEASNGVRVAIVMLPSTAPESIEQFTIRLAEQRTLGRKGVDDGMLVVVAKDDRAVRIEVGLGLQGVLPDVLANRITDQVMVPQFRQGQYFAGLDAAVDRIAALAKGESLPAPPPAAKSHGVGTLWPLLLMAVMVAGGVLRRVLGRFGGSAAAGGVAGVLGWLVSGAFIVGMGAALLAFAVTLFGSDRGRGWSSGRGGRFGGGFGGGSGGFGGGGSWGGGGGTFNGGGATGRW
jgi:uncharacterized protein